MCFLKCIWMEKLVDKLHTKDSFRFVDGTRNRNLSSSTILPRVAHTVYPDISSILCERARIPCAEDYLSGTYILTRHSGCAIWSFSQIACQACHCYLGPRGSTRCRPCSQCSIKSRTHPLRKLAGRKIIITQSLSNHSGDYRSGHLLCTQSIINQFSFSKVGLVFCANLKTKACCLAVCLRLHLTHILATDGVYNMLTSDLVQFYNLTYFCQQTIYLANEGNARSRQHQCALGLLHDFCLLGCCS